MNKNAQTIDKNSLPFKEQKGDKSSNREKLKGYKVTLKQFRRNLNLKSKNMLHGTSKQQQSIKQISRNVTPLNSNPPSQRTRKALSQNETRVLRHEKRNTQVNFSMVEGLKKPGAAVVRENPAQNYSPHKNPVDKRMTEYLNLLLKKNEKDKIKQMEKEQKNQRKNGSLGNKGKHSVNMSICKRMKAHSIKVKMFRKKNEAYYHDSVSLNESMELKRMLDKLRKTEKSGNYNHTLHPSKHFYRTEKDLLKNCSQTLYESQNFK